MALVTLTVTAAGGGVAIAESWTRHPLGTVTAAGVGSAVIGAPTFLRSLTVTAAGVGAASVDMGHAQAQTVTAPGTASASAHLHDVAKHRKYLHIGAGSFDLQIVEGGQTIEYIPMAQTGRGYAAKLLSANRTGRGYVYTWSLRSPPMLIADVATVEALLDGPGSVLVAGVLLGTNQDVLCYASDVQRRTGDSLLWAALSFRLTAASPMSN